MSWSTSELRVRLAPLSWFKPSSKIFTDRSKAVLLLWIFYVFVLSCVCHVFVRVCLYVLCGHLLGNGWPLGSRLWCLTVSLSLSHWYPGSGVVLDCINSWSLHPYLLPLSLWRRCFYYIPTIRNIVLEEELVHINKPAVAIKTFNTQHVYRLSTSQPSPHPVYIHFQTASRPSCG